MLRLTQIEACTFCSGSEKDVYTLVAKAFTTTTTRPEQTPQVQGVIVSPEKHMQTKMATLRWMEVKDRKQMKVISMW